MTTAAGWASMRLWAAKTIRPTAAVMPTVKVLVAAATFTGTCMISLITGVLMNPPPTPESPDTMPAPDMALRPSGTRVTR